MLVAGDARCSVEKPVSRTLRKTSDRTTNVTPVEGEVEAGISDELDHSDMAAEEGSSDLPEMHLARDETDALSNNQDTPLGQAAESRMVPYRQSSIRNQWQAVLQLIMSNVSTM